MLTDNLKDKIKSLPKKPGVYFFRDQNGKIIYIGKALSLKNRVRNAQSPIHIPGAILPHAMVEICIGKVRIRHDM